ncbi:hypothetical protein PENTCL1PPCAC_5237, partial [Pristionchus entomophagus]
SEMPTCVSCGAVFPTKTKHMHQFTLKQRLRDDWLTNLTKDDSQKRQLDLHLRTTLPKQYVCASHFSDDSYFETNGFRVLKANATPICQRPSLMDIPPTFRFLPPPFATSILISGPNGVLKIEDDTLVQPLFNLGKFNFNFADGSQRLFKFRTPNEIKEEPVEVKEEPVEIKQEPIDDFADFKHEEPMVDVFCPSTGISRPLNQQNHVSYEGLEE